jgi:hypothetical protein
MEWPLPETEALVSADFGQPRTLRRGGAFFEASTKARGMCKRQIYVAWLSPMHARSWWVSCDPIPCIVTTLQ